MISLEDAARKPLPSPDADTAALWRGLRDAALTDFSELPGG